MLASLAVNKLGEDGAQGLCGSRAQQRAAQAPDPPRNSVSAVLPCYNARPFIDRAIDSILAQQGDFLLELIVVDDCSEDGTADHVRRRYWADCRVQVLATAVNGGPGAARNVALGQARGEWIALIDADDAWQPQRLRRMLAAAKPAADLVFDNLLGYDQHAGCSGGPLFSDLPQPITLLDMVAPPVPGHAFDLGYLKPLVRRAFLEAGAICYGPLRANEDLLFYLELLARRPRTRVLGDALYVYTTQVGHRSGLPSRHSRTRNDPLATARELDAWAARNAPALADAERRAVAARAEGIRRNHAADQVIGHLHRGEYVLASLAAANRDFLACCLAGMARRLGLGEPSSSSR